MVDRLLKSHVFVQTSSIENSPNSLGEAMLLGMPCVASSVGGTADMLRDKEEGFLYRFDDEKMLVKYITDIFEHDKLAIELGKKAKQHANNTHNRLKNTECIINIYKELIK
jgi:glycosyltransferase involved in cell wall biosynthesis